MLRQNTITNLCTKMSLFLISFSKKKNQIILELIVTGNALNVLDTVILQINRDASPLSRKKMGKRDGPKYFNIINLKKMVFCHHIKIKVIKQPGKKQARYL